LVKKEVKLPKPLYHPDLLACRWWVPQRPLPDIPWGETFSSYINATSKYNPIQLHSENPRGKERKKKKTTRTLDVMETM
jgi:hypothetical protein